VNVLSLFSGIGGLDLGLERAGMTVVAQCERGYMIDRDGRITNTFTREMLAHRWPNVPLHDDVTTLDGEQFRGRVDLVAGGSPCQDLSVAGRRQGLDGARSGLFWHQCRIADQAAAPWVVWENVGGALSSNDGADFAAVLWGLTGTLPGVPDGGWGTAGVVVGPKRSAVWRVLDARWFGVAQRRRRVFVVAGPGDRCGPEVLLEPEGLRGNPRPGGQEGSPVAALTSSGVGTCGPDDNQAQAGHLIPALTTRCGATFDDQQVGQLVPMAVSENQRGELRLTEYTYPLAASGGKPGQGYGAAFGWANAATQGDDVSIDESPPLRTTKPPAAYQCHGSNVGPLGTLRAGNGHTTGGVPFLNEGDAAVRRLTPRECERLMGWPDDHTRWTDDGREIADSHRYRACGNGVVTPVAEWIGNRIVEAAA